MSVQAVIDHELCSGYGNCVVAAPEVFELLDSTGQASVIPGRPQPGDEAAVTEAAVDCPMRAIRITTAP